MVSLNTWPHESRYGVVEGGGAKKKRDIFGIPKVRIGTLLLFWMICNLGEAELVF